MHAWNQSHTVKNFLSSLNPSEAQWIFTSAASISYLYEGKICRSDGRRLYLHLHAREQSRPAANWLWIELLNQYIHTSTAFVRGKCKRRSKFLTISLPFMRTTALSWNTSNQICCKEDLRSPRFSSHTPTCTGSVCQSIEAAVPKSDQ